MPAADSDFAQLDKSTHQLKWEDSPWTKINFLNCKKHSFE